MKASGPTTGSGLTADPTRGPVLGTLAAICLWLAIPAMAPRAAPAASPQLVRGPYLQLGTATGAVVRWNTDAATPSRVVYGPSPGQLDQEVLDGMPRTEHAVELTGLQPATRYYYGVGTDSELLAGPDPDRSFVTAPPTGSEGPTRVWVIGDSGTGNANADAVYDAFLGFAAVSGRAADLWLMLGDNAYAEGTDSEYQDAVFETYPALLETTWLWPAFGNHDSLSADSATQTGPYFDIFTLPTAGEAGGLASGTEAYYSFDHANVHFVCLDTSDSNLSVASPMMEWLEDDVAATDQEWIIAFWHHPPYSHGSHDSDDAGDSGGRLFDVREHALPILEAAGVDLVLSGHSHSYERSFLLYGHYGTSGTLTPAMVIDDGDGRPAGDGAYAKDGSEGAVYAVAGSSGKVTTAPLDHPAMFASLPRLGSMVVDVEGPRLDAIFLSELGEVLDEFTMEKALFVDGFESGGVSGWSSSRP